MQQMDDAEAARRAAAQREVLKDLGDHPDGTGRIEVLNGRYGPYITNKEKNAKIPKDKVPKELTLEECQALLAAAPERRGRGMKRKAPAPAADAKEKNDRKKDKESPAKSAKKTKKKSGKKKKKAAARKAAPAVEAPEA